MFPFIQNMFQTIAMANVSKSALQAVELGFAKPSDDIVFNAPRAAARGPGTAPGRCRTGYQPPPSARVPVASRNGIATCEMMLINMRRAASSRPGTTASPGRRHRPVRRRSGNQRGCRRAVAARRGARRSSSTC